MRGIPGECSTAPVACQRARTSHAASYGIARGCAAEQASDEDEARMGALVPISLTNERPISIADWSINHYGLIPRVVY